MNRTPRAVVDPANLAIANVPELTIAVRAVACPAKSVKAALEARNAFIPTVDAASAAIDVALDAKAVAYGVEATIKSIADEDSQTAVMAVEEANKAACEVDASK